jgi:hypothetical protein
MTIEEMREKLLSEGYQILEHIFNEGKPNNCILKVSKSQEPLAFDYMDTHYDTEQLVWGRYEREECWQRCYHALLDDTWEEPFPDDPLEDSLGMVENFHADSYQREEEEPNVYHGTYSED